MRYARAAYVVLGLSAVLILCALATPASPLAAADGKPSAVPAAPAAPTSATPAQAAGDAKFPLYVNSKVTKDRFDEITAQDMDTLRTKKILFASRSFGLNLCVGLRALAAKDKKYDLMSSYKMIYNVNQVGGDLSVIPADVFKDKNFVHFLCSVWPLTKRTDEIDELLRHKPHDFGQTVDIVIIFYAMSTPETFEYYSSKMDALRHDFPKIKFIYVTAGFMASSRAETNEPSHAFSELIRARYKGQVPLYDLGAILSDDFRCGHAFCPEYSKDPAGGHPNLPLGEEMMAKGFLLVLRDACKSTGPANSVTPLAAGAPAPQVETLPVDSPDYKAVRAILDANGLQQKKVESVAVVEKGRVVRLYLQEGGIRELPDAIGTLTELRVLHLYGDRNQSYKLLETISPAIARCTKLEDLLINQNDLRTLPPEIATLTNLKLLSLADNHLKDLPPAVVAWAHRLDRLGLAQQKP